MSTERRGRSRTKRLIAVPPLRAKQVSVPTWGNTRTRRATCDSKTSLGIVITSNREKFCWERDLIARVEMALRNQLSLSFPEIDGRLIQMFEPGMSMPVRVPEKEALYLHTLAFPEELSQQLRTEIG